jgi:UDP-N-acetylmuramate dehydrogenase
MQEIYQQLKQFGHVRLNEPLSKQTTFKIGGPADFFIEVNDNGQMVKLLNWLSGEGINFYIIGGGSNMLFSDEGFRGVVIKNKIVDCKLQSNDTIVVSSGTLLSQVVNEALKSGLSGLEWASGIPGTVGGAVRGNAGAMGQETANGVEKVEIWQDGEVNILKANDCGFGYRESVFKKTGGVILRTWYKLVEGDKQKVLQEMQNYLKLRNGRYPKEPNAGSFFKNIPIDNWPGNIRDLPELFVERGKIPVGWLVEQVGMKGFEIGGARISNEHGNFIVNFNGASQTDILTIVEKLQEKIYNKFNVEIEPEVEIVK